LTRNRHVAVAIVALAAVALAVPAFAAEPTGTWITHGGKSRVRIARCGPALCGTLISLAEPNDPATGRPRADKNNPDASKRARPVIGLAIVLGMKPSGTPDRWTGQVYNPEDGKTYSGSLTMRGGDTLELEGCAFAIFCKSQTWTRAN
jgi:uncharacterized protein (DUF2147 family)